MRILRLAVGRARSRPIVLDNYSRTQSPQASRRCLLTGHSTRRLLRTQWRTVRAVGARAALCPRQVARCHDVATGSEASDSQKAGALAGRLLYARRLAVCRKAHGIAKLSLRPTPATPLRNTAAVRMDAAHVAIRILSGAIRLTRPAVGDEDSFHTESSLHTGSTPCSATASKPSKPLTPTYGP